MSDASHTPGPWFINGPWHVQATPLLSDRNLPCVVAQVVEGHGVMSDERLPNARLIAAAPDLLAACKLAKDRFDKLGMDWLGKNPDPLEAAIAKAEGDAL